MTTTLPWNTIDTVLLDMDGTLLDLHFDNYFWLEYMPQHYARHHGISLALAKMELEPRLASHQGQLNWYCLDFWSRELDLPIAAIKREIQHLISLRPDADGFLKALHQAGKRAILITNAHPDSLSLKLERIELRPWFEHIISAHSYGVPKEHPHFWTALQNDIPLEPHRCLFIDDSLAVLRSGQDFGIAHLRAIYQPDSQSTPVDTGEFHAIKHFADLTYELQRG